MPDLVRSLARGDHVQEVAQLLCLRILLGQVLQAALRAGCLRGDQDLSRLPGDGDLITEVSCLTEAVATTRSTLKIEDPALGLGKGDFRALDKGFRLNGAPEPKTRTRRDPSRALLDLITPTSYENDHEFVLIKA